MNSPVTIQLLSLTQSNTRDKTFIFPYRNESRENNFPGKFGTWFPREALNQPNESPELLIYLEFIDREIKRRSSEEEEFSVQVSIVNTVIFSFTIEAFLICWSIGLVC